MKEVHLGDYVEDMITGFEGIAIARTENLFGGVEFKIQQRTLNGDDRPQEPIWIEAGRLTTKEKTVYLEDEGCITTDK